ncbi:hypothetical protein KCP77_16115 [Salmonella enterica subsp. enterica]|nr:hypothetical protein KCP77_16115 [Salmonella enterica subsp. enterica]
MSALLSGIETSAASSPAATLSGGVANHARHSDKFALLYGCANAEFYCLCENVAGRGGISA